MAVDHIVINYGSPRSGTTFMWKCLGALQGALTFKLAEGRVLHPCQSKDGLVELCKILRFRKVILIRTIRHPLEIAESLVALRDPRMWEGKRPSNISKFTDKRAVEFITLESKNTERQRPTLLRPHFEVNALHFIEVRYEDLADPEKRKAFIREVTSSLPDPERNFELLSRTLGGFGTTPVRRGRLAAKWTKTMDPKLRSWFERELREVILREGYGK